MNSNDFAIAIGELVSQDYFGGVVLAVNAPANIVLNDETREDVTPPQSTLDEALILAQSKLSDEEAKMQAKNSFNQRAKVLANDIEFFNSLSEVLQGGINSGKPSASPDEIEALNSAMWQVLDTNPAWRDSFLFVLDIAYIGHAKVKPLSDIDKTISDKAFEIWVCLTWNTPSSTSAYLGTG